MRYAFYEKADLSILTNGNEWRIYDPYDLRDMIFEFSLDNMEDKLSYLWLLSKSSIENRLFDKEICKRLFSLPKLIYAIAPKDACGQQAETQHDVHPLDEIDISP